MPFANLSHSSFSCPYCANHQIVSYGTKRQIVTDLPQNRTPTHIVINRRRYRCKSCCKTFLEPLPGVEDCRSITTRLTAYIETQALTRSFVSIAQEVGITEGTVRNIFDTYLARQGDPQFQTPSFIVLEPISILNKVRYLVGNVRSLTIIDILETDTPEAVADYLRRKPGRDMVEFVLMDARDDVRLKVWEELPSAQTIVGSRHFISLVAKFCDEIRRRERARCSSHQRRGLVQDKTIFGMRKHELSPDQLATLDRWRGGHEEVLKAYLLKESFCELFDLTGRKVAKKAFEFWDMDMDITYRELECPLSLPNATIDSVWPGELLRWFEFPSIKRYEQEVAPLLDVLPKIGRKHSFKAVRAKILSAEEGRTHKGISIGALASVIAGEINTILRLSGD